MVDLSLVALLQESPFLCANICSDYILVKGENMQAYNVVNEKSHITIADMAKFVAEKIAEKPIEVVFDIPKENKFGYASDTKMHLAATRLMALGWQPETDLEESYRRLIASMKNRNV